MGRKVRDGKGGTPLHGAESNQHLENTPNLSAWVPALKSGSQVSIRKKGLLLQLRWTLWMAFRMKFCNHPVWASQQYLTPCDTLITESECHLWGLTFCSAPSKSWQPRTLRSSPRQWLDHVDVQDRWEIKANLCFTSVVERMINTIRSRFPSWNLGDFRPGEWQKLPALCRD